MRKKAGKKYRLGIDAKLCGLILILTFLGIVVVADASAPSALRDFGDKFHFAKQQATWAALGVALMFVLINVHYKFWEKLATPLFWGSVVLLLLVLIPGIGSRFLGAKRWLFIGSISIQPAEIVKFSLILYLAKLASKEKQVTAYFLPIVVVAGLIMLQPDLGTTLVVVTVSFAQLFLAGVNLFYLLGAGVLGIVGVVVLILSSDYRRDRLSTFLSQTQDPLGKAYHIRQVLLALGSGGFLGVGLGQSRQKYLFLPETASDSIFAVIAEEAGFLGAVVILCLFGYFIYRGLKIADKSPDKFSHVLAAGVVAWIGGQAFLNIGSMVALVPLTGIPLPFLSYGGSSLTSILMASGILLNISKYSVAQKNGRRKH